MGYEEGLGKTRPQNLRTQREEKQKKNDKPHIRQLVGYGLRCGQDSLAFSNELFGGFLMHGKKLDVSRIMKFVMLMSGMVICFA